MYRLHDTTTGERHVVPVAPDQQRCLRKWDWQMLEVIVAAKDAHTHPQSTTLTGQMALVDREVLRKEQLQPEVEAEIETRPREIQQEVPSVGQEQWILESLPRRKGLQRSVRVLAQMPVEQ